MGCGVSKCACVRRSRADDTASAAWGHAPEVAPPPPPPPPRSCASSSPQRRRAGSRLGDDDTFLDAAEDWQEDQWHDADADAFAADAPLPRQRLGEVLLRYKRGDAPLCKAVGEVLALCRAAGVSVGALAEADAAAAEAWADAQLAGGGSAGSGGSSSGGDIDADADVDAGVDVDAGASSGSAHADPWDGVEAGAAAVVATAADVGLRGRDQAAAAPAATQQPSASPTKKQQHNKQQQQRQGGSGTQKPRRPWAPTAGDSIDADACRPLPPGALGCGGAHLFSAAHVLAHARNAAALLGELDASARQWRQVAHGSLQMWHLADKAGHRQCFRTQCVLEETLVNMLTICREVDLAPAWNPALSTMETLVEASPAEVGAYLSLWLPWPFAEPEVRVRALGMNLLASEGLLLVALQDLGDDLPPDVALPPCSRARQRYHIRPTALSFRPLAPDARTGAPRTECVVMAVLDVQHAAIPDAIVSFLLKVFAPLVHRSVTHTVRRLFHSEADSALQARQRARAALYAPLSADVDAALAARGWPAQGHLLRGLAGGG